MSLLPIYGAVHICHCFVRNDTGGSHHARTHARPLAPEYLGGSTQRCCQQPIAVVTKTASAPILGCISGGRAYFSCMYVTRRMPCGTTIHVRPALQVSTWHDGRILFAWEATEHWSFASRTGTNHGAPGRGARGEGYIHTVKTAALKGSESAGSPADCGIVERVCIQNSVGIGCKQWEAILMRNQQRHVLPKAHAYCTYLPRYCTQENK